MNLGMYDLFTIVINHEYCVLDHSAFGFYYHGRILPDSKRTKVQKE